MTDSRGREVIRCYVKGDPDQLLARAATVYDADAGAVPADGEFSERYLAENRRLGEQGLRVMATARKDFDPAAFDPEEVCSGWWTSWNCSHSSESWTRRGPPRRPRESRSG